MEKKRRKSNFTLVISVIVVTTLVTLGRGVGWTSIWSAFQLIIQDATPQNVSTSLWMLKWHYLASFVFLGVGIFGWAVEDKPPRTTPVIGTFVLTIFAGFGFAVAAPLLQSAIAGLYIVFRSTGEAVIGLPTSSARSVGLILIAIISIGLFMFRIKHRSCYGLTEVAFAMFVGFKQLPNVTTADLDLASSMSIAPVLLTGSVYLAVRGMDNVHQGLKNDSVMLSCMGHGRRFLHRGVNAQTIIRVLPRWARRRLGPCGRRFRSYRRYLELEYRFRPRTNQTVKAPAIADSDKQPETPSVESR